MKQIAVLLFLYFIPFAKAQTTLEELNTTIMESSNIETVALMSFDTENQLNTTQEMTLFGFTIPNDIKETTVIKYDEQIKSVPSTARSSYQDLYPNLNIKEAFILPEYYLEFPEDQSGGQQPLIFTPMILSSAPLIKADIKGYKTKISLVLFSEKESEETVHVKLEIVSNKLKADKNKIVLSHLNLPSTDVTLFTDQEQINDSVAIRILTNSNLNKGYTHYIKVKPTLTLSTNKKEIQGLGVQNGQVLVRFIGSNSKTKEKIMVSASNGEVKPESFELAYNEAKMITVRSEGLDDIKITAATASSQQAIADSNTLVIKQTFPFVFLMASLIGGLLGMLIKLGFKKDKKISPKLFLAGVLIGFLGAVVYYVLGINVLKIEVASTFNEFAVLGFSALCSLLLKPTLLFKV